MIKHATKITFTWASTKIKLITYSLVEWNILVDQYLALLKLKISKATNAPSGILLPKTQNLLEARKAKLIKNMT